MQQASRHRPPNGRRLWVALAAGALAIAACGDDDADVASTPTTAAVESTTSTAATASSGGSDGYGDSEPATSTEGDTAGTADTAGSATVDVAETTLGEVLVADGKTLYVFTPDAGGASTCYDDCATAWPPLLVTGEVGAGAGVDAGLLATSPRTDGGDQVTVDGQPLYFYAGDAAPGDTNGQGIGGKWYVVGPDGAMITG